MQSQSTRYYVLLLIATVIQHTPLEINHSKGPLEIVCDYDIEILCPECFISPPKCDRADEIFKLQDTNLFNVINNIFNSHSVRVGTNVLQNQLAVLKHLNRDKIIEKLKQEYCDAHLLPKHSCEWAQHGGSIDQAKAFIINSILDNDRIEGCIFCPAIDNRESLQRFLDLFEPTDNELWNLLAVRTNVEPLIMKLFQKYHEGGLPVYIPKLLHTFGFAVIESYEGKPLEQFYNHPLIVRMRIASKLIKAAFMFTEGVQGFRIFLTDINPDNVVVKLHNDSETVQVSIVDLDNVIILDSWAERFDTEQTQHVHSRIDCNGCFAYVQEDVCRYQNSDLNLFATCQLLLENMNGNYEKGLLHYNYGTKSLPDYGDVSQDLHNLLKECVYCQPSDCRNRFLILQDVLQIIDQMVIET